MVKLTASNARRDASAMQAQLYIQALPQVLLDLIASDLNGAVAQDYRGFVRRQVVLALPILVALLSVVCTSCRFTVSVGAG